MALIRKELTYLILFLFAFQTGCESLSPDDIYEGYPVFIERMELSDLQALNDSYHQRNNGLICSTLNEYGLTGFSRVLFPNDINPCFNRIEVNRELPFDESFVEMVKLKLVENAEFTGVSEKVSLVLKEITSLDGCTICEGPDINNVPLQWKFTFEPQELNDIEITGTDVVVYLDSNGINRIWGSWYPVIDPGFIEFGSNKAKSSVIGTKVRYANKTNQVFEQEIAMEHISGEPKLKFVPVKVEEGLEIHKAWVFKVLQEHTTQIRWEIMLSTIDGEVLEVKLL